MTQVSQSVQFSSYVYTLGPKLWSQCSALSKATSVDIVSAVGLYVHSLIEEQLAAVDGILASRYAEINAEQSNIHSHFRLP